MGNENGLLGKYVAFHNYSARISAEYDGLKDSKTDGGRRPTAAIYHGLEICTNRKRIFYVAMRYVFSGRRTMQNVDGFGENLKNNLIQLRNWAHGMLVRT